MSSNPAATFPPAAPPSTPGGRRGLVARRLARPLPFLLVAVVIAISYPTPLVRPEFWAEDATEFFFGAIALGPRSILVPVYGYQFLLERLIAYAATFLPVFYTPHVYAWSSLVVNAAALSYLSRDGFAWIAPERWQRVLLAVLLALGPGTSDVLLNLTNLQNPLALLGFLVLVERPSRMSGWRLLGLLVLALSSGLMLLWIPVAAWVAWRHRSRGHLVAAVLLTAVAAVNAIGTREASKAAGSLDLGSLPLLPEILVSQGFARLLLVPFLGVDSAERIQAAVSAPVYWTVVLASAAAVAWLARREHHLDPLGTELLLMGFSASIGMLGLVALTRSYNVPLLLRGSGTLLGQVRYSFLPMAFATLIWSCWLLRPPHPASPRRFAVLAAFGLLAFHLAAGFNWRAWRPDLNWVERSARVQALLDLNRESGVPVVITMKELAIHPVGWIPDNRRVAVLIPGR